MTVEKDQSVGIRRTAKTLFLTLSCSSDIRVIARAVNVGWSPGPSRASTCCESVSLGLNALTVTSLTAPVTKVFSPKSLLSHAILW